MKTVKISISLPRDLYEEIKPLAPNLSSFIAQGLREFVTRERARRAIEESAGAWSDENHPELREPHDVERYVREIRAGWRRQ